MTDDRYDKVVFRDGKTVDKFTRAALLEAEKRLGYELTIVQGSYHGGVGASAGTHDGGGAVDLAPYDWQRKVRVLREVGFAAWHRLPSEGPWGEHIHAIQVGNDKASPAAQRQVTAYRNGRNGLANNAADTFSWRPDPIPVFKYDATPEPAVKPLNVVGADFAHHFKGNILWQLARNNGVRFIVHKVTEGATVVDPAYRDRRAEGDAFNAGLSKVGRLFGRGVRQGGYHYASPDGPKVDDAEKEADWFLKHLIVGDYDVAPWLDFEELNGLTLAQADRWCVKFIARVRAAGIKRIGLYTNFDLPDAAEAADFVVRARYSNANAEPIFTEGPNAGKPAPYDVRQFSNGVYGEPARVPGFGTGTVDLNALRKGFPFRKLKMRAKAQTTPEPPVEEWVEVRDGWFNIGAGSFAEVVGILRDLGRLTDKFSICEASDRDTEVEQFLLERPNWRGYWPDIPGGAAVRSFWNTEVYDEKEPPSFERVHGALKVTKDGKPGKGAGPGRLKPKAIVHLHLRHKASGRTEHDLADHFPASWTRTEKSLGAYEYAKRRAAGALHVTKLADLIDARKGIVTLKMDANATPGFALLKALRDRLVGWTTKPTLKDRAVDHVVWRDVSVVEEVSTDLREFTPGDHKGVIKTRRFRVLQPGEQDA